MENSSLMALKTLYQESSNEILEHFFKFLSFQSISSEETYKPEMQKCVNWLKAYVEEIGFQCELWPTSGHPVLYAHWDGAGPDQPTLLIYNHYDVQPIDPIEEWESPPF
ncbi:MAG: dipeptidase, partial [Parachlamydiaceae bacterium]